MPDPSSLGMRLRRQRQSLDMSVDFRELYPTVDWARRPKLGKSKCASNLKTSSVQHFPEFCSELVPSIRLAKQVYLRSKATGVDHLNLVIARCEKDLQIR